MRGESHEKEVYYLIRKIASNASFINKSDLEILRFLSTKGDFEKKEAILNERGNVSFISEVEEFNELMGKSFQNRETPTIDIKDATFVIEFIQEELDELKEAVENHNIVEVLDAICDIAYVGLGNGVMSFGLKNKILPAYAEVQASNLSKVCKTVEEAVETVKVRSEQQNEPCHYELVGDNYIVYRTRDLKVMKSINYFRPDLKQFFTKEELSKFNV